MHENVRSMYFCFDHQRYYEEFYFLKRLFTISWAHTHASVKKKNREIYVAFCLRNVQVFSQVGYVMETEIMKRNKKTERINKQRKRKMGKREGNSSAHKQGFVRRSVNRTGEERLMMRLTPFPAPWWCNCAERTFQPDSKESMQILLDELSPSTTYYCLCMFHYNDAERASCRWKKLNPLNDDFSRAWRIEVFCSCCVQGKTFGYINRVLHTLMRFITKKADERRRWKMALIWHSKRGRFASSVRRGGRE